jgi:hypothetical protein
MACAWYALPLPAESIHCEGVLGNSGEQGAALVRFSAGKPARGLGVVADRYGALWDRAGGGRLNRYAADGRLLASYRIPGERSSQGDAIAAAGDTLILCLDGGLHALPIDAPPDAAATPLKIEAERMSLTSHDGWVAAAKGKAVFLVNAAGEKKPLATLPHEPWEVALGPDGAVYDIREGKAYRITADNRGEPVAVGGVPGERTQFVGGFWYGAGWGSALRRFDSAWQPVPGVVLGGNSGSFIGHVDEQSEIVNPRGLAKIGPDLFAASGLNGILHLLEWREQEKRFTPLRRIGAVPSCIALALDREGRVWWLSGNWNWNDGPATPLRFGVPEPDTVFALTMLDSDNVVGYGRRWGRPNMMFGKLDKELRMDLVERPTIVPREGVVAAAVCEYDSRPALLLLEKAGAVAAVAISDSGQYQGDIGAIRFQTAAPVKEWTSLVAAGRNALLAAGDGFVIELAREGRDWKETRRWNSWGADAAMRFGGPIWLSADAGRLWVSDSARHRVLCFDRASGRELAAFGQPDAAGDDLRSLRAPSIVAARGPRAVVYDSGNQRLLKLRIGGP